jgi:hypothetical protein
MSVPLWIGLSWSKDPILEQAFSSIFLNEIQVNYSKINGKPMDGERVEHEHRK